MAFDPDWRSIAATAIDGLDPSLKPQFLALVEFHAVDSSLAPKPRGANALPIGSAAYITWLSERFVRGRQRPSPTPPRTIPDPAVRLVLEEHFNVPAARLSALEREHLLAMGAEGFVGNLLERYLAEILEPAGWVWCSGNVVKSVDFILKTSTGSWKSLQIKNRSNSENSSSSAVRAGTAIEKWFRMHATRGTTNWHNFPGQDFVRGISEEDFRDYISQFLRPTVTEHHARNISN